MMNSASNATIIEIMTGSNGIINKVSSILVVDSALLSSVCISADDDSSIIGIIASCIALIALVVFFWLVAIRIMLPPQQQLPPLVSLLFSSSSNQTHHHHHHHHHYKNHFASLFLVSRGWSHRLAGGIHFGFLVLGAAASCCWMVLAVVAAVSSSTSPQPPPIGSCSESLSSSIKTFFLWYDILLGCSGLITTITAANDFPHKYVRNIPGQSGTLSRQAIVTHSEMMEHSFYQGLNLLQSIYLHTLYRLDDFYNGENNPTRTTTAAAAYQTIVRRQMVGRIICLWLVTAPWLIRHKFPVHSFSQNWSSSSKGAKKKKKKKKKLQQDSNFNNNIGSEQCDNNESGSSSGERGEVVLYRIKKAQYVFYKHVILHGLNISMALATSSSSSNHGTRAAAAAAIPYGIEWRIFWLLLNTSYVMEFFLQTLVKRSVLSQSYMITLQRLLMASATIAAINVLFLANNNKSNNQSTVRLGICFMSVLMNYVHRHHDVANTMCIAVAFLLWDAYFGH